MKKLTAEQYADKIWGTDKGTDRSEFNIPLSSAINMMEQYHDDTVKNSRLDVVSDSKPIDTFDNAISFLKNEMEFTEEEIENIKRTGKEKVMEFINDFNSR